MKYLRISLIALIALAMTSLTLTATANVSAQTQSSALERGFRTGYSDGYNAGFKDAADKADRDYQSKDEYQRADRSYNQTWGTLEDYRDGYQQGFEAGYTAGFDRRPFDSTIPAGIGRRGSATPSVAGNTNTTTVPDNSQPDNASYPINKEPLNIPRNSILMVELQSPLSTDVSQQGDRFQARVIQNPDFEGAIVEGRVSRVKRPGKVRGTAELQLDFDNIRVPDGRTTPIKAEVIEVIDMGYGNAGTVDSEGGVRGKGSTKDDVSKVGASTGIGAIIGAIAGGGKGAAIGAAIGGAIGTGAVLTSRGKDIRLDRGQQLKIRTSTDTRIQ